MTPEIVFRPDSCPDQDMAFIFETIASAPGQHQRVIGYEQPAWYPEREQAKRLVIQYLEPSPAIGTPEAP